MSEVKLGLPRRVGRAEIVAAIRAACPPVLFTLARRLIHGHQRTWALNDLDRKLRKYLDYPNGYFVELGANDGITQSNTILFEKTLGWRGVLIEPVPHNYLACLHNRATDNKVFCNACTSFDYKDRFVEIVFANLMSCPVGLDSDVRDPFAHAEEGSQFLAETDRVFSFGAIARPLSDILVEAGAPQTIDLLSLDVEGAELEVLKGIDHRRFRFKYMCIECREISRLSAYLSEQGYECVEKLSYHDYLFAASSGWPLRQ